jgi:hypothetical protein
MQRGRCIKEVERNDAQRRKSVKAVDGVKIV